MSARSTLILAALAACLAFASPAGATPAVPTSVFDPNETSWLSYRNLTSSQFASKFAALKADHMVIDLEVDVIDGDYRVGAVFRKNPDGRGWASLRNLTSDEFHERWTHYRDRGYRLVDQETYVRNGDRQYAGVWVENREGFGWASYRGVTSAEFSEKFDHYRDRGYLPIDFEVYTVGNELRHGAIWVENRESLAWKLKRNMTSAQFSSTFQSYADQGLRSLDFEAIETGSGRRYAGIWVENRSGRGWYLYRDLTATQYRNRWNQLADKGYRLDNYEKYPTSSGVRYSGIWRQNSSRPNWPLRADVDAAVKAERDEHDVPGIGIAIAHDGKLVYLGGAGDQDVDDDVWMHSGSVNRIASVSKAVSGALAMRMVAEHPSLDLDDPIQDYLPQLPAHHTYTVRQALMNRSCLVHYPGGHVEPEPDRSTASSLEVLEAFADQALGCTPGQYAVQHVRVQRARGRVRRSRGHVVRPDRARRAHAAVRADHPADREPRRLAAGPGDALRDRQRRVRRRRHHQQVGRRRLRLLAPRPHPLRDGDPRRHDPHARTSARRCGTRSAATRWAGTSAPPTTASAWSASPAASRAPRPTCGSTRTTAS